ncbi:hypothetical protein RA269_27485, partial [Pseudomonas syringae pv. tagetis]|uniref:hypothetical protein n=1 Tax=Pseudomonas syringae group genomosp. 7 TaxID=251699 RepID=UPI00376FA9FA
MLVGLGVVVGFDVRVWGVVLVIDAGGVGGGGGVVCVGCGGFGGVCGCGFGDEYGGVGVCRCDCRGSGILGCVLRGGWLAVLRDCGFV